MVPLLWGIPWPSDDVRIAMALRALGQFFCRPGNDYAGPVSSVARISVKTSIRGQTCAIFIP